MTEFHVFLPQMRLTPDALVGRAQAAEAAGFVGMALMDHLTPPLAAGQPMYEAMTMATWIAAHTRHLTIGHLVLCDSFRAPAVLARQAVTLDHVSGGRFELGIGSGSTPEELAAFGLEAGTPRSRTDRLAESLEVLTRLWAGEPVHHAGTYHQLDGAQQLPTPLGHIPLVIGGTGPRTMELVARHADWWNVPAPQADRLDGLRDRAGRARVSLQQAVTFVPDEGTRREVTQLAERRFGWMPPAGVVAGSGPELVDHFGAAAEQGVERFYLWFTDFAAPETLARFGAEVIAQLG